MHKQKKRQVIELVEKQKLVIESHPVHNDLSMIGPDGSVTLTVHVSKNGPVVQIGAGRLTLEVKGDLAINAGRITINGREEIALSTAGNIRIDAAGDLSSCAHSQSVEAKLGNVDIKANDDVTFDGERIRMNC